MTNATGTVNGNKCTITIPANPTSVVVIPNTSGAALYTNYCKWSMGTTQLGEWSAQQTTMSIVSNPHNLINTTTKHGTITTTTNPVIAAGAMEVVLTHKKTNTSPVENDALKLTVIPITPKITVLNVLAEDGYDQNYLDFQLTIIVHTK